MTVQLACNGEEYLTTILETERVQNRYFVGMNHLLSSKLTDSGRCRQHVVERQQSWSTTCVEDLSKSDIALIFSWTSIFRVDDQSRRNVEFRQGVKAVGVHELTRPDSGTALKISYTLVG
ncbi:hypothetical protein Droror1_Dr00001861 [Drosera rotundifolia]